MSENEYSNTNILILGKTGVGKSSLLNYLFGDGDIHAKVGDGKPTTSRGIHRYPPFAYNGITITVHDSWGLEPDKAHEWQNIVEDEVKKNNAQGIKDWFHTVVYCVDAQRARFEPFEDEKILRPLMDGGNHLFFALTKSDLASEEEKRAISEILKDRYPECSQIPIASVATVLVGGRKTEQSGREEMLEQICFNLRSNLITKCLTRFKERCRVASTDITGCQTSNPSSILGYFDEKAGIFTHFGEDFKNDLLNYAKKRTRTLLDYEISHLRENINFAQQTHKNLSASFSIPTIIIKVPDLDVSRLMPSFESWDNDFGEYLATAIAWLLVPGGTWARKGVKRDEVVDFCDKLKKRIDQEIDRYIERAAGSIGALNKLRGYSLEKRSDSKIVLRKK